MLTGNTSHDRVGSPPFGHHLGPIRCYRILSHPALCTKYTACTACPMLLFPHENPPRGREAPTNPRRSRNYRRQTIAGRDSGQPPGGGEGWTVEQGGKANLQAREEQAKEQ